MREPAAGDDVALELERAGGGDEAARDVDAERAADAEVGRAGKTEVEAYPAGWRGWGTRVVRVPYTEGTLAIDLRDPTADRDRAPCTVPPGGPRARCPRRCSEIEDGNGGRRLAAGELVVQAGGSTARPRGSVAITAPTSVAGRSWKARREPFERT